MCHIQRRFCHENAREDWRGGVLLTWTETETCSFCYLDCRGWNEKDSCPRFHKAWIMLRGRHQRCTSCRWAHFYPRCLFFTKHSFLFHFCLVWVSPRKASESLKAPLSTKWANLYLWGQHRHEKQCWLAAILPAYYDASPLSAAEVKHLESLGTGPTGDANEGL